MHVFFSHACNACIAPLGLVAPPKEFSDLDYVMGTAGTDVPSDRRRRRRRSGRRAQATKSGARRDTASDAHAAAAQRQALDARATPAAAGRRRRGRRIRSAHGAGLNIVKPPYGLIVAINMDKGDLDVVGAARRHA